MDEDLILQEIVKSLAFEIEAVNQDNTLKWTTTDGTPLNVKVRVRNKDEPRLIQRGAIPVPRIGITAPEKLRLISSDQTILSFNVYLESGLQRDPKRDNGLKKFNIGSCLGTYSDDEGPYLPGSSEQSALESDSCSQPGSEVLKKNVSPVLNSTNTIPRNQKTFFGKCKPGGCLDPPFDEENYAYSLSNSDRKENIQLVLTPLEDNTKTCEPGGCLDPPFSEDKYPYTNVKAKQQEKQVLKSQVTKDKKQALGKKSLEEHIQHKTKEKKMIKNQEDPKNLTDIHARISKEDSIITYPTDVSSNETLYDQNTNKKMSIKSNNDEAQKQSYDYPVSYFVPPKDVTRNKDDERRYSKRLSYDTINRSSKGTVHDEANKAKSVGHDYMPNNALLSKDIHEKNLETKCTDDVASKSFNTNKIEVTATKQENADPDLVIGTPSYVLTDVQKNGSHEKIPSAALYKERASRDLKPIESNSNYEIQNFKSQPQTVSSVDSDKSYHEKSKSLEENIKIKDWQTRPDASKANGADKSHHEKPKSLEENIKIKDWQTRLDASKADGADKSHHEKPKSLEENIKIKDWQTRPDASKANGADKSHHEKPKSLEENIKIKDWQTRLDASKANGADKSHHEKPKSLEENIKIKDWQTRPDAPKANGADKERNDKLPQLEASYIKSTQPEDRLNDQREKHDTDSIKQLKPTQENSKFSKTQSPINGNSKSNLSCDNDDGISKKILVAEATIPVLATTILALSEKQSIRLNDKPNIGLDSSMIEKDKTSISKRCSVDFIKTSKQKLQREHDEIKNVSPQRISSSENNEFDVSSEHSIDSKHDFSNKVDLRKPDETLGHRNKHDLLAENLNSKSIDNVIISSNTLKDYIKVEPGSQTKKTSEILQKKPFTAKHNLNSEQDDINKTAPLKRKTFTVISSNTSIQKSEEIEELPENTIDVYYKTTDKSQLGSPDSTEKSKNISDTNNKNPEGKISPRLNSVPGNRNDLYLNVTNDTTPTTTSEKTKEIDSTLNTNFNENQSHLLLKKHTDINPTNNQTKPLDSIPNENRISTDPLPIYVRDIQSNIVDGRESVLTVQKSFKTERLEEIYQDLENTNTNYKDIESLHKPEIIQDLNLINDEAKNVGLGNQLMEKAPHSISSKYSLQNSYYDKSLHAKVSDSDTSTNKRKPEHVDLGKRESENMLNIDSNIFLPNQYTDNLRSKTVTDSKLDADADSIRELLPENTEDLYTKIQTNDKSASFTEKHEEQEFIGIKDVEIKHSSTSGDNPDIDISQKLLTNNAHSDYSVDSASDYKHSNVDATQFVEPEFVQNYDYSVMTNKSNGKTDRNDLDYEKLDKSKHPSFISNITPDYVEYLPAQTANDWNYADIDQRYDNSEFLDARRNENPMQRELTENISELPSFKNSQDVEDRNYELINETESFAKYSSHSGGYSDLISGVLSNISENKDEEDNDTVQNKLLEGTIQRHENILQLDDKASHDQEAIFDKFESISKDSESNKKLLSSIKSSVATLKEINRHTNKETKPEARKNVTPSFDKSKQRSDTYETDFAKLNIFKDDVFIDNTSSIIDQRSEYKSLQTPASTHDLSSLNKKYSRTKPVSHTGSSTLYKQPNGTELKVEEKSNIVATESTALRDMGPLYLDMSFCSYVNDNKQRIVQTQSPLIKQQTPIDGTVTIVKTLIRHGHEIRIPVDSDNDITLNILDKDLKLKTRNSNVELPMSQNRREKQFGDRAKKQNAILNKNLSLIYESELIPLHTVIKDLTQEVNKLATKQETLQKRVRNIKTIKSSKSLRLIPVVKRCGCRRI